MTGGIATRTSTRTRKGGGGGEEEGPPSDRHRLLPKSALPNPLGDGAVVQTTTTTRSRRPRRRRSPTIVSSWDRRCRRWRNFRTRIVAALGWGTASSSNQCARTTTTRTMGDRINRLHLLTYREYDHELIESSSYVHPSGEIWSMACHPTRSEYVVTCGGGGTMYHPEDIYDNDDDGGGSRKNAGGGQGRDCR